MKQISIAIDGPAGAGKSSVAKIVAKRLGYTYLDTGAMYRAFTWYMQQHDAACTDDEKIKALLETADIRMQGSTVKVNGTDVTAAIRSAEVSAYVSRVAAIKAVREKLADWQRAIAKDGAVILDGRDIGTVVLPNAELKIFLTASSKSRAMRRWKEVQGQGGTTTFEEIQQNIEERDTLDSQREESPLRQAEDAILLDNSELNLEQTAEKILDLVKGKLV